MITTIEWLETGEDLDRYEMLSDRQLSDVRFAYSPMQLTGWQLVADKRGCWRLVGAGDQFLLAGWMLCQAQAEAERQYRRLVARASSAEVTQ